MNARVQVGLVSDAGSDNGFPIELFRPFCLDHDQPWFGPETFDLDTAKTNARVHDADRHAAEVPDA